MKILLGWKKRHVESSSSCFHLVLTQLSLFTFVNKSSLFHIYELLFSTNKNQSEKLWVLLPAPVHKKKQVILRKCWYYTNKTAHLVYSCVPTSNDRISSCRIQPTSMFIKLKRIYTWPMQRFFFVSYHKRNCDFSPRHGVVVRMAMRVARRRPHPCRHLALLPVTTSI